jgi:hypothetical protein
MATQFFDKADVKNKLLDHLRYLSVTLGERSIHQPQALNATGTYVYDYALNSEKVMAAELTQA